MGCDPSKVQGGEGNFEGCLATYTSSCRGGPRLPQEGNTLAPWVRVKFEGSGGDITVGNDSSPSTNPKHVACIKSFEFGYSDGLTLRLVIHDEQGGSFVQFMNNLLTDWSKLKEPNPATCRMEIQFGWSASGCNTPIPGAQSRCYYCLSDSVETNFTGGKFIFEITGKDLCHRMFEGGSDLIYGGTGQEGMCLVEAIEKFMTAGPAPNVGKVKFLTMKSGVPEQIKFEKDDQPFKGPKSGPWKADGQDKLRVVMRWLEGHLSENKKSWVPQYNSEEKEGELIFWEDTKPRCSTDRSWDESCIGAYVVNGGKKSPVIEFNPKIRWDFARLVGNGGNLSSEKAAALPGEGSKNPGRDCPGLKAEEIKGAGHSVQTTPTESSKDLYAGDAAKKKAEADAEAIKAIKVLHDNVEADLVIVGDPTILPPSEAMWSKNIAIVVVNPYFLTVSGNAACGEWMANPVCNEVLSNKAWICKSITHRIESGNYTTTIGVYLTAPGIDVSPGTPVGGDPSGWTPPA